MIKVNDLVAADELGSMFSWAVTWVFAMKR